MLMFTLLSAAEAQQTPFEKDPKKNTTATYPQIIRWYEQLDAAHEQMRLETSGTTDIGKPLHVIILSRDKIFDPETIRKQNKRVLFINNGIHPGEPEGIDASMMLTRDLLTKNALPKDVVIVMIAVYNIDGCLNRGVSRINQNGPETYGFRGNYQNLDLNRDFIKADSRNSRSFQAIVSRWQPDIFWDNHTSNGADYQYIMTLIETQHNKLQADLSAYMTKTFTPELYRRMKKSGYEMTPYVNPVGETPESGIAGFLDLPRYSTGYMALHNVIGYMPETHMLKTFEQRVLSTCAIMNDLIRLTQDESKNIAEVKKKADEAVSTQENFALNWDLDTTQVEKTHFLGYEAGHKKSEVSGLDRLFYDRKKPFEKDIPFFNTYKTTVSVKKPVAYIVPHSWEKVIERLKLNRVVMHPLKKDTLIDAEMYRITDLKNSAKPFEGHYLHSNVSVKKAVEKVQFFAGDLLIYTNQPVNRYIVETLEPQGADSFFAWGFFDAILGQKEHFSDYVFEDDAAALLKKQPELRAMLEEAKKKDPELAASAEAQLTFIYDHSPWKEPTFRRYPVGRILHPVNL